MANVRLLEISSFIVGIGVFQVQIAVQKYGYFLRSGLSVISL